jgi:hypothetical protein
MSNDDKHFEHIAKMQSLGNLGKWWSWDSPIGLSVFFLTLTLIGISIVWTVLQFIK